MPTRRGSIGYNPQSWNSYAGYHQTPEDEDRTAFLFNLTTNEIQRQSLGSEIGELQTYNATEFGPSFGSGIDVSIGSAADRLPRTVPRTWSLDSDFGRATTSRR